MEVYNTVIIRTVACYTLLYTNFSYMFGSSKRNFVCSPFKFLHNATHQENKHTYRILDKPFIHFRDLTMVHKLVEQLSSFCCATWHIWTLDGQKD